MTPRALPTGLVTLVFTDIEGSTALLHELGDGYGAVLDDHHRLLREVWAAHDGVEVDTEGDAFFVAFASARGAVSAAAAAQERLAAFPWPGSRELRVRMGVHSGEPQLRDGTYWGIDVHYAARLCSAAHGGQVLLSAATRPLVGDVEVEDLGEHPVKDFPVARHLFHLLVCGRRATDFPPPRTLAAAPTNLPTLTTPLVGREDELAEIAQRLTSPSERLVTLTGLGGSGKTKLAIAAGSELLDRFPDGVFLVGLAPVVDVEGAVAAFADVLRPPQHPGGVEDGIVEHVRRREILLVVDNMEHVIEVAPLLGRLIDNAPGLRLLVTSQAPLRLAAESVLPLAPLALPQEGEQDPSRLADVAAVRLFVERARAADPGFALDASNAGEVVALCRALDGLPLGLELAAARVRMAGVGGVLAALGRGIDALGRGGRDLPDRQRGLRAALDFTISLLDPEARELFAGLGAFADAWTLDQAEVMFGDGLDVWEAMATLLDLSLIRRRGDGRLTMAERVKRHARELLEESGREHELRRRHAELMAETVEALDAEQMLDHAGSLARTREVLEELEYALAWSRAHDPELQRRLIAASGRVLVFVERLSTMGPDLVRLTDEEVALDAYTAGLRMGRGMLGYMTGDVSTTVVWTARALEAARATDASDRRLLTLLMTHAQGLTLALDGPGARATVAEGLRLAADLGDERAALQLEGTLAFAAVAEERWEEAEERLMVMLDDPGRTDFASLGAHAYLADCALGRGDAVQALERYVTAVDTAVRAGDRLNTWLQLCGVAASLVLLQRDAEAARLLGAVGRAGGEVGFSWPYHGIPPVIRILDAFSDRVPSSDLAVARAEGERLDFDAAVAFARSLIPVPAAG